MDWKERIILDPAVRGGKSCVRRTRTTVYDVLESLAGEMGKDETHLDFPDLPRGDIRACLAFEGA